MTWYFPQANGGSIVALETSIETSRADSIVQFGSQISLNGEEMKKEDIDIDELYDTVMKSSSRR